MILQGIPCRGEPPPIKQFMDSLLAVYSIRSTLKSDGTWSFEGTDDAVLKLVQDMFSLDGDDAAAFVKNQTKK